MLVQQEAQVGGRGVSGANSQEHEESGRRLSPERGDSGKLGGIVPDSRSTDPSRWAHVNRVFHHAVTLTESSARDAYLEAACAGTPEVLVEVRSLLEWDQTASGFLDVPLARVAEWPTPMPTPAPMPTPMPTPMASPALSSTPALDLTPTFTPGPALPPPMSVLDDPLIGSALGAWRITGIIGRGGMGSVYRAERADAAFRRQAAIKVVRLGRESAPMIERFRRERETLAALDHPNIARLLDGGATAEGQPYFVMELVDGVPIDRYCDEHRLTIDQRLDLWRAVCAGVQYAHENLVIHRDIKPDNILVADDGTPKLLDFGIAKLLSGVQTPVDDAGAAATWLMTPDYASPEQLFGKAMPTLSSDVYSLGVLLYVLLTGVRPYHLSGTSRGAVQAELTAAVLRPPSARVMELRGAPSRAGNDPATADRASAGAHADAHAGGNAGADAHREDAAARAAARGATPRELARRLRGDLDAIVLRALARDAGQRYSTVDQLASDLERHRTSHPVAARGRDLPYLARTFVRRHAVGLGVLAALVVAAFGAMGVIVWQARQAAEARSRAESRFEDVRRLAHAFIFDVHDAVVNIPGTTSARMLMVRTTVNYLERLAREASSDRDLQRELAGAFVKVGDAQGDPTGPNLGDTAGALASYRRAAGIADALVRESPDDLTAGRTLALAHRRLADTLAWSGDMAQALAQCETSERLFAGLAARPSPTLDDRLQAAIAQIKLGDLLGNPNLPNLGRTADADARYAVALASLRALSAEASTDVRVRRYHGLTLERIGTLREQAKRWDDAAAAYRASFDIRQALAAAEPSHMNIQRDAAIAYEKLGNVELFMRNAPAAEKSYRGALARFERLLAGDPSNATAARTVAISQEKLAEALTQLRQLAEARTLLAAALAGHRTLAARDPDNAQARCEVGRAAEALGDAWAPAPPPSPPASAPRAHSSLPPDTRRGGPIPDAACVAWKESLHAREALRTAGAQACTEAAEIDRVSAKLRACR
jgi:non-specific serine/threonine protein kinase/serine/threonine-protein kinase